jgi:hypothetical protein
MAKRGAGEMKQLNLMFSCSRIRAVIGFSDIEDGIKDTRALLFFHSVRWLERRLSARSLYWILRPHAFVRAAVRGIPAFVSLACPDAEKSVRTIREERMKGYLSEILECLPERLVEPKWISGCRFAGLDRLQQARQTGRPVVLAFRHFGPYCLLRPWLHAAGFPVSVLVGGKAESRSRMRRRKDRLSLFPGVPPVFNLDQLRAADKFLAAGNSLLVAIDYMAGKQMDVPVGDGRTFRMATGAVRLAIRHRAELIPCSIIDEGRWRFQINLGRPVPAECLATETDLIPAGKHLLNELLPPFRNHSGQCSDQLIRCSQPSPSALPDGKSTG